MMFMVIDPLLSSSVTVITNSFEIDSVCLYVSVNNDCIIHFHYCNWLNVYHIYYINHMSLSI